MPVLLQNSQALWVDIIGKMRSFSMIGFFLLRFFVSVPTLGLKARVWGYTKTYIGALKSVDITYSGPFGSLSGSSAPWYLAALAIDTLTR